MKEKNKVDLVIVTNEPFPSGMAATNRLLTYASEIAKQRKVKVLIAKPTELPANINNSEAEGFYKNIAYKYIHNTTIWPKDASKVFKALLILEGLFLLFKNIVKYSPKAVLLVSNDIKLICVLLIYSKMLKFYYYLEKSEKPPVIKKKANAIYKRFYLSLYKYFDGIIVMTKQLVDLFTSLGQKNIFHLPMTVDIERFSHVMIKNEKSTNFIFKYCGGGNYERDGLINMIEAFIDLKKINKNFEFQIIGPINNNSHYYQKAVTIIEQNKAQDKIKFLGSKSSNEIPGLLSRADCLIMTPPKDFDSGGFPTKLGEYLATGIPVICTKVSEIPIYLNESSAILVAPNNHNALVEVLIRVISNYNFCKVIGINGKIMAQKYFSAEAHTKRVIQFLKIY